MHFIYANKHRDRFRFLIYGGISLCFLILVTYLFHKWVDRLFVSFLYQKQALVIHSFFENFTQWMDTIFLGKYLYLMNYRQGNSMLNLFLFRYLPLLLLWATTRWLYKHKNLAQVFLWTSLCHFLTTLEVVGLKYLLSRSRPLLWLDQGIYFFNFPGGSGDSFPSGHTADYLALFLPLAWYYRRYAVFILCIPMLIAWGRIALWMHYPSDVLVSVYLVVLTFLFTKDVFLKRMVLP